MAKRRSISAAFKGKVAIEALRDDQTLVELASRRNVLPNPIDPVAKTIDSGLRVLEVGDRPGFLDSLTTRKKAPQSFA